MKPSHKYELGGALSGSAGLAATGAAVGSHIGIAALGTAISGMWPLAIVGLVIGGVAGKRLGAVVYKRRKKY